METYTGKNTFFFCDQTSSINEALKSLRSILKVGIGVLDL